MAVHNNTHNQRKIDINLCVITPRTHVRLPFANFLCPNCELQDYCAEHFSSLSVSGPHYWSHRQTRQILMFEQEHPIPEHHWKTSEEQVTPSISPVASNLLVGKATENTPRPARRRQSDTCSM